MGGDATPLLGSRNKTEVVKRGGCSSSLGYSAPVVLLLTVVWALTTGIIYCISLFTKPILRACPASPPLVTPVSVSLMVPTSAIAAALCGRVLDRVGPRVTGLVAGACLAGGLALAGLGVRFCLAPLIVGAIGLLVGLGAGGLFVTIMQHALKHLPKHRGLAAGCMGGAVGAGAFIYPYAIQYLVLRFEAEYCFYILAGYVAISLATFALARFPAATATAAAAPAPAPPAEDDALDVVSATLSRPAVIPDAPLTTRQILWSQNFRAFFPVYIVSLASGWGLVGNLTALFDDVVRVNAGMTALCVSVLMGAYALGRVGWGVLSDHLRKKTVFTIFVAGQGICLLALAIVSYIFSGDIDNHKESQRAAITRAVAFVAPLVPLFTFFGGAKVVFAPFTYDLFPAQDASRVIGLLMIGYGIAGMCAPLAVVASKRLAEALAFPPDQGFQAFAIGMAILSALAAVCLQAWVHERPDPRATSINVDDDLDEDDLAGGSMRTYARGTAETA